jgi:hypothetical protein
VPFLRSRQLCSYSRLSQHFMQSEGSLPCSQQPSTGPYPKPDQTSPYHPVLSLLRFILVLSTHPCLGLPHGLFTSVFPYQCPICIPLLPIQATCTAHLILLNFIILIIFGESTSYEAPHYAVFSNLLSLHLSLVQIFSSAACSQMPHVYVPI